MDKLFIEMRDGFHSETGMMSVRGEESDGEQEAERLRKECEKGCQEVEELMIWVFISYVEVELLKLQEDTRESMEQCGKELAEALDNLKLELSHHKRLEEELASQRLKFSQLEKELCQGARPHGLQCHAATETFGQPRNKIDPFTQEDVESLGEDKLVLSNGHLTTAVSGANFLEFVKREIDNGRSLKDMVLRFEDTASLNLSSLDLSSVDLSSQVWASCHIREENYASELMWLIYNLQAMVASYERRLATFDAELLTQVKIFVHDLIVYGRDGNARHRLEARLESQLFYLSEVYFTPSQKDTVLAFPGKNGLTLQTVLEVRFKNKKEVCSAHTLAPIIMTHFNISKDFQKFREHRDSYKAFCKAWRNASELDVHHEKDESSGS